MKVKELKEILSKVDENAEVKYSPIEFTDSIIRGFYVSSNKEDMHLVLTNVDVRPTNF